MDGRVSASNSSTVPTSASVSANQEAARREDRGPHENHHLPPPSPLVPPRERTNSYDAACSRSCSCESSSSLQVWRSSAKKSITSRRCVTVVGDQSAQAAVQSRMSLVADSNHPFLHDRIGNYQSQSSHRYDSWVWPAVVDEDVIHEMGARSMNGWLTRMEW